jgi:thiol-disulfide isomerase/thioredoxin
MKTVIKYGAGWCGPCKMYAPTFNKVAGEVPGVSFQSIDVDSGDPRIIEHGVRNVPTTVVVENGVVINRQSGNMSADQLKALIG